MTEVTERALAWPALETDGTRGVRRSVVYNRSSVFPLVADELKLSSKGCEVVIVEFEPFARSILNLARLAKEQTSQPLDQILAVVGLAPHDYIELEWIKVAADAVPQ